MAMETKLETQLSFELQEMYLENKEWLSDILFLEDEMRFFQQIFKQVIASPIQQNNLEEVEFMKLSLVDLQQRRNQLNGIVNTRQGVLEAMLKDESKTITIAFVEEDTAIVHEIKALLATDKEVKSALFALIETLQPKVKTQKYPIL